MNKGQIWNLVKSKNAQKKNAIRAILDNTERIIRGTISLVNDFRDCKSLLNAIFNLLNVVKSI